MPVTSVIRLGSNAPQSPPISQTERSQVLMSLDAQVLIVGAGPVGSLADYPLAAGRRGSLFSQASSQNRRRFMKDRSFCSHPPFKRVVH
jgi:hypothetical protein